MSTSLLDILYELTLFVLLCLLLYRLVQAFVLPMLRGAINQDKKHKHDLEQETELLQDTRKRIGKETRKQEQKLAALEEKIRTWHAARLKKVQAQEDENRRISAAMLAKKEEQRNYVHAQRVRLEVVPEALIDAHEALVDILSGEGGITLFNDLIDDIKRRAVATK